jgi:thiosulfate/3-mercaptopyruvate sulfurtransferase
MAVETDTSSPKFAEYADPGRLVTGDWLQERLGTPGLVVVESDEDVLLYETGHIPGAVKVDWHTELNDPVVRDYVDGAGFARLLSAKGISRDDTVVIYGDKNNWWAAYALWVFSLFGHEDVRLLDGGRDRWIAEGRPLTTDKPTPTSTEYPVVERDDTKLRAYKEDVLAHLGNPLIDVRSGVSGGGGASRRPHPDRQERAVGARGGRGRRLQEPRRARSHLPRRGRAHRGRPRRGVLPHRRAVEPHVVRAPASPRLR